MTGFHSIEIPLNEQGEEIELSLENIEKLEGELLFSSEIFVFLVILFQIALFLAHKRYPKQVNILALLCMWLYPVGALIIDHSHFISWVYILLWAFWSAITLYLLWKATAKPLAPDTPEKVYTWFLISHSSCYYTWAASIYIAFLIHAELGFTILFLSLYFGVLTRDFAEVASERLCSTVGYSKYEVPPINLCALCGEELRALLDVMQGKSSKEAEEKLVIKLNCSHEFHENCIRGWAIVGKKDTCPFCFEKIELKTILPESKWNSKSLSIFWVRLLHILRFLIVWNPLVVYTTFFLMHLFHLNTITDYENRHVHFDQLEKLKHSLQANTQNT